MQPKRRPRYEVADILDLYFDEYAKKHRVSKKQRQVVAAVRKCRTGELGGHVEVCSECGHREIAYNSCRDRHCPKCQRRKREEWVRKRLEQALPIPYYLETFTLPGGELREVMRQNQGVMYEIFFASAAETLHAFAADAKYLGARIGFIGILHTWSQTLSYHPHLHFIVTGGGISRDGKEWVEPRYGGKFLFPVRGMSKVMRGKFISKVEEAYERGELEFRGEIGYLRERGAFKWFLRRMAREAFVIDSQGSPREGATAEGALRYIGRYVQGMAISNYRIEGIEGGRVRFRYKDNRDGKEKEMELEAEEFIRRWLQHVLPAGFRRVRHYGILGSGVVGKMVKLARELLRVVEVVVEAVGGRRCPVCGKGEMIGGRYLRSGEIGIWERGLAYDTS